MPEPLHKFIWGEALSDEVVGPYTVRAFHPHKVEGSHVTKDIDRSKIHYHGYINGKDCNESWLSLDEALAGMITRRSLGPNRSSISEHFIAGIYALMPRS